MLIAARIVLFLFSALLILGGIDGFVKAHSAMSLMAGILCGGLGLYGAIVLPAQPKLGLILGIVGAVIAIGGMAPRLKNKKTGELVVWPAMTVVAFSALTAVVAAAALATGAATPSGAAVPASQNAASGT